jgi:hypothetical protein
MLINLQTNIILPTSKDNTKAKCSKSITIKLSITIN